MAVIRAFENENPFSYTLVHPLNTAILQDRGGVCSMRPTESHQCDLPYPHDITQETENWAQHELPACLSSLKRESELVEVAGDFFKAASSVNKGGRLGEKTCLAKYQSTKRKALQRLRECRHQSLSQKVLTELYNIKNNCTSWQTTAV